MVRNVLLVRMCLGLFLCSAALRTPAAGAGETPAAKDVPAGNPRIALGAWAPALSEHPRLFGSRDYLRKLAKEKPQEYQRLRQLKELLAAGVVNAVEGAGASDAQPFIAAAMKHVGRGPTNEHQDTWIALTDVVLTYDLFHDQIAPADRARMIAWFNAHLGTFTADENAFHNSTLSKILCLLRIAYGTWGENPRAKEFRDHALVKLYEGTVLPVLKEFGAGGGFTECGWYARGSLWHLVQAMELARRFERYDGFAMAPRFFYQRMAYELYDGYPGLWIYGSEQYPVEGDGSNIYGGHTEYPREMRTVLAQYFRGSELAGYVASKKRRASNPQIAAMDFLYEEPAEPARPLAELPLAHFAEGIGKVYARSDWTDSATWLRFDCGGFWTAHQHFDVGNFEIYRYEPLATESGEYAEWGGQHAMNWLIRTVAHNCILVYEPGEQWTQMRDGGRVKCVNDGGQAKKWDWPAGTVEQWMAKRQQYTRGKILAYENQPQWLHIAADCTQAYAPEKLSLWVRQIVFLRPGTFVVFDRVVSRKPEFEKTWLLHCKNEPQIDGSRTVIRSGKGELVMQTLLPAGATPRKVEGYTYRGQTFEAPKGALNAAADRWRVEVAPGTPATEDLFLNVLFTEGPQKVELLRQGAKVGVKVGANEILFDGKVGGQIRAGGQQWELRERVVKGKWE
ncbi:MAG: heparinase II/III family protein [Tepidisphaerales bacterium]